MMSQNYLVIYGILGMIQLITGPHLMVITGRRTVGRIFGRPIWNVTEVKILPCSNHYDKTQKQFTDEQLDDEDRFLELIKYFIQVSGIYWSSRYDLTRSFQLQADENGLLVGESSLKLDQVDRKYFLNRYVCEPFLEAYKLSPDCLVDHFIAVCIEGCNFIASSLCYFIYFIRSC